MRVLENFLKSLFSHLYPQKVRKSLQAGGEESVEETEGTNAQRHEGCVEGCKGWGQGR